MPRLVSCQFCRILQRMPDVPPDTPLVPAVLEYTSGDRLVLPDEDGHAKMVPAYDPVLEDFVGKHEHGMEDGATTHGGMIQVYSCDQRTWDAMDIVTTIKKQLQENTGHFYEERDEYREAATKCYNEHGNPDLTTGCRDYMDDSKRIGPASYDDGEGHKITVPPKYRHYLCYLCPYQHAYIQVELRRRKGMYKEGPTPRQERALKRRHR